MRAEGLEAGGDQDWAAISLTYKNAHTVRVFLGHISEITEVWLSQPALFSWLCDVCKEDIVDGQAD